MTLDQLLSEREQIGKGIEQTVEKAQWTGAST